MSSNETTNMNNNIPDDQILKSLENTVVEAAGKGGSFSGISDMDTTNRVQMEQFVLLNKKNEAAKPVVQASSVGSKTPQTVQMLSQADKRTAQQDYAQRANPHEFTAAEIAAKQEAAKREAERQQTMPELDPENVVFEPADTQFTGGGMPELNKESAAHEQQASSSGDKQQKKQSENSDPMYNRTQNTNDAWSGTGPEDNKGGTHEYNESRRPHIEQVKIQPDGRKKAYDRAGEKAAGSLVDGVKRAANDIDEDEEEREIKRSRKDVHRISSMVGANQIFSAAKVKRAEFRKTLDKAAELIALSGGTSTALQVWDGSIARATNQTVTLADFQGDKKSLERVLNNVQMSNAERKRMLKMKDDIVGFFAMKDAVTNDFKQSLSRYGIQVSKTTSMTDVEKELLQKISTFKSMDGIDLSNLDAKDMIKLIERNADKDLANIPETLSKEAIAAQRQNINLAAKNESDTVAALFKARTLKDAGGKSFDSISSSYMALSKNEKIRSLADEVTKDGMLVSKDTYKGMTTKEANNFRRNNKIGRRADKMTDKQIKALMKEAKNNPAFSDADRTLLKGLADKKAFDKKRNKAPGIKGVGGTLGGMFVRSVENSSGVSGLGTTGQAISFGVSAFKLIKTSTTYLSGRARAVGRVGKKVGSVAAKAGRAIADNERRVWSARYQYMVQHTKAGANAEQWRVNRQVKRDEKNAVKNQKKVEKQKEKNATKRQKAEDRSAKQTQNAQKKAERRQKRADQKKKFDESKLGKGTKKAADGAKKAGKGAKKAADASSKALGKVAQVVLAPLNFINTIKAYLLKFVFIAAGIFLCVYLALYMCMVVFHVASRIMDGWAFDLTGALISIKDWFTGKDSRSPYEIIQALHADLRDHELEVDKKANEMLVGVPQDPNVLAGHMVDHYARQQLLYLNADGEYTNPTDVMAKRSAIAIAYVMVGQEDFYTMDREAKQKLVNAIYDYMAAQIEIDETPLDPSAHTVWGNVYLCDKQAISHMEGPCSSQFLYHCTGNEYYTDMDVLQNLIYLGVGAYRVGGTTAYYNAADVLGGYQPYGCYVDYTATCNGHSIYEDGQVVHTYYHNGGSSWSGSAMSRNFANGYISVSPLGTITYTGADGTEKTYTDTHAYCYNHTINSYTPRCNGTHTVNVCYGHKDGTVIIYKHDFRKVIEDKFIPHCDDAFNNFNEYIEGFEWNAETEEQVRWYVEDIDWESTYGVTE